MKKDSLKKLLVIMGPTATGKTSLALKIAEKFAGEIVSADSRQVYKGMDIGTGKDLDGDKFIPYSSLGNRKIQIGYYLIGDIKVWLYDVVKPDYQFNLADYVECADLVIRNIWNRGKLPILVGGTGFYIKGITEGIGTLGIKPNWQWRKEADHYPVETLREMLNAVSPERLASMNESDRKNPRRLIRALEIAQSPKVDFNRLPFEGKVNPEMLFVGLRSSWEVLYSRIDKRIKERSISGIEKEIDRLLRKGFNFENSILKITIGYQEWQEYFKPGGKNPKLREEIIEKWRLNEHHYAKRQMTWFKKNKQIFWFDIIEKDYYQRIERLVEQWYDRKQNATIKN